MSNLEFIKFTLLLFLLQPNSPDTPSVKASMKCLFLVNSSGELRIHRKTAKIIHDFNSFCNLDMNQKLVSVMIIKISYLCTLHNEIISPAHLCCLHVVAVNAHLLQH